MNRDTENNAARSSHPALGSALEQAQRLSDSRPEGAHRTDWSYAAAHVGDLSVLALAFRD